MKRQARDSSTDDVVLYVAKSNLLYKSPYSLFSIALVIVNIRHQASVHVGFRLVISVFIKHRLLDDLDCIEGRGHRGRRSVEEDLLNQRRLLHACYHSTLSGCRLLLVVGGQVYLPRATDKGGDRSSSPSF